MFRSYPYTVRTMFLSYPYTVRTMFLSYHSSYVPNIDGFYKTSVTPTLKKSIIYNCAMSIYVAVNLQEADAQMKGNRACAPYTSAGFCVQTHLAACC